MSSTKLPTFVYFKLSNYNIIRFQHAYNRVVIVDTRYLDHVLLDARYLDHVLLDARYLDPVLDTRYLNSVRSERVFCANCGLRQSNKKAPG